MSNPHEIAIAPTKLQEDIQVLLEEAGISERSIDEIMKLVEDAELSRAEAQWERHQESLMENGPGPSLLDQQREAMKFK